MNLQNKKALNVPKLRFPEFKGRWKNNKLGDIGSFKSGVGFSMTEQGGKSGVPFFKVSDMNLLNNQKVMVKANNYVNDEQISRLNYKPIKKRSIIFAKVGAAIFLERKRIANNFLIDNNMMAFTPNENIAFISQWFETIKLSKYAKVGVLPSYNASDLRAIKINLPYPSEQQKIADCLTSLDEIITKQSQKLNTLKAHKKGLMQNLFPAKGKTTPRLRFPEFQGRWKNKKLGTEGRFLPSLTGKSGEDFGVGVSAYITYMNVFTNTFVDNKILGLVDIKDGEKQNAVIKGDVMFTVSSETRKDVGMSSVLLEELENCYLNSFCTLFRFFKKNALNSLFLGYCLRQQTVRKYFANHTQGIIRFNLSRDIFKNLPFLVPDTTEQQKIANCLTSLDEIITAQSQKIATLKAHKKGLIQQLFPIIDEVSK